MKFIKSAFVAAVIAVSAFASVSANAAYVMTAKNGDKITVSDNMNHIVVNATASNGEKFFFRGELQRQTEDQIDNAGNSYNSDFYRNTIKNDGSLIVAKKYLDNSEVDIIFMDKNAKVLFIEVVPGANIVDTTK